MVLELDVMMRYKLMKGEGRRRNRLLTL
jgi:hypothetical protein